MLTNYNGFDEIGFANAQIRFKINRVISFRLSGIHGPS